MATPASPLAATAAADTSFDAAFDAAMETSAPAPEATDDTAAVEDTPAETADPVEEPAPVEETEPEPEATPEPAAEEDEWDDNGEIKPEKTSDNGKTLHFSKQKASRLLASHEFQRKVSDLVPGATPEDIARHYESAVYTEQMMSDFDSADPQRMDKFVNFWFGPQSNPKAIESFGQSFIQRLPHAAPGLFKQVQGQATQAAIQGFYEQAMRTKDESLLTLAQNLDHKLNGKYLTADDFKARDPYAEERANFERERDAFNTEKHQNAQAAIQQRSQSISSDVDAVKASTIEAALDRVKEQFKDTPHWKNMIRDLSEKVEQALSANKTWQVQFNNLKDRAIQDTTGKSAEDLKAMMKNFTQRTVEPLRKGVIDSYTGGVLSANKQAHKTAADAAARREPNGSQAPASRASHQQQLQEAHKKGGFDAAFDLVSQRMR